MERLCGFSGKRLLLPFEVKARAEGLTQKSDCRCIPLHAELIARLSALKPRLG
jgi:hypothetical protein